MRRNAIDFKTLLRITEEFCEEKGLSKKRGRGRPPVYPMSVILAICLLKTMLRLSYGQTEAVFALPSLSKCPRFFHLALQSFNDPGRVMARILKNGWQINPLTKRR